MKSVACYLDQAVFPMSNGKPGDHPITDVTIHNRVVFGDPWDSELRRIVELLGYDRAHQWFNAECWLDLWKSGHLKEAIEIFKNNIIEF